MSTPLSASGDERRPRTAVCVNLLHQTQLEGAAQARKVLAVWRHAKEKTERSRYVGRFKAENVFVRLLHHVCAGSEERDTKALKKMEKMRCGEGGGGWMWAEHTQVCIFIHNSSGDGPRGLQRALMRCINTNGSSRKGWRWPADLKAVGRPPVWV